MARIGAFVLVIVFLACLFGCEEKTSSAVQTGLNLSFANCISFGVNVFIDGDDVPIFCSTDVINYIDISAGQHSLFARSNITVGDTNYCWTENFSVSDGQITEMTLDCIGAHCENSGAYACNPPLKP